jgi:hypothetical protein
MTPGHALSRRRFTQPGLRPEPMAFIALRANSSGGRLAHAGLWPGHPAGDKRLLDCRRKTRLDKGLGSTCATIRPGTPAAGVRGRFIALGQ